jgi:hypothetical protein
VAVSFRDLWDHPETWRGRRVIIRGRLVRTFRQEAFGDFPALVEAWMSTPRGDLFCVVHPRGKGGAAAPRLGAAIRFTGTFLKTIRYAAADTARLAPLVVGDRAPVEEQDPTAAPGAPAAAPPAAPHAASSQAAALGRLGLVMGLAAVLALALAWYHWNKPVPILRRRGRGRDRDAAAGPGDAPAHAAADPPLEFLDRET